MIHCDECGERVSLTRTKRCPSCGASLRPEFEKEVKREVGLSRPHLIILVGLGVALLCAGYGAWWSSTHYFYEVKVTEKVTGKNTHTETHVHYDSDGNVQYIDTDTDYYLYLNKTGRRGVWESDYYRYNVGDNYTYPETRSDWKPGMEGAPIPMCVGIVPVFAVLLGLLVIEIRIIRKRKREMNEFDELGDLEID